MTAARSKPTTASKGLNIVIGAVMLMLAGGPAAHATTIDDFSTVQALLSAPPDAASNQAGGGILGGQRDLELMVLSGPGPATVEATVGELQLRVADTPAPDSQGRTIVTWDGDTDPGNLDPDGLLGVDLTTGGHTGFRLTVEVAGAGAEVVFDVYTDGANMSRGALVLPAVVSTTSFDLSFSTFAASLGGGADFTDVGAITMSVTSIEQDVDIAMLETVGPAVVAGDAVKTDTLFIDNDGDGRADPGDTLRYTITITNTGAEATSVDLNDVIQPNLTPVADSLYTAPIPAPDTFESFANVQIVVPPPGVLENDHDPDGESFTVTGFSAASAQGGSVAVGTDGAVTYEAPPGFTGVDTFTYTVTDDGGRFADGVATVIVDSVVWFVDNSHAGPSLGTLTNPFGTLAEAEAASSAGEIIFVFAGTGTTTGYDAGIALKDEQELVGEGSGLSLGGSVIVPPGVRPTIGNTGGNGIVLAASNSVRGLDISNTVGGVGILGIDPGTLTVSEMMVSGTGGGVSIVSTGVPLEDVSLTLDNVTSTSSPSSGLLFDGLDPTSSVSIGGTTVTSPVGIGIAVSNAGGATFSFGATDIVSGASGILLDTNGSASFTFDSLAVTASAGTGLRAHNSGTVTIGGISNSVSATGGAGVDVLNTSLGTGWSFTSVSSSASPTNGIILQNVTGSFTANGGTIGGAAGDSFLVDGGSEAVTYGGSITNTSNNSVEVRDRTGGLVAFSGAIDDDGLGINLMNNGAGTVTLAGGLDLDTTTNQAFTATGGGTVTVTGTNTIDTTTGTALRVENTNIGASGLTFQSVSSNGATNGIVLNATGTVGGLTVTGTGSTSGSGGTIQTAADAVSLTDTSQVTLSNMGITNNTDSAITGSNITDLVLNNVSVSSSGNAVGENSIDLTNLRGSANAITNSVITASITAERAVSITNTVGTGTADVLTITGSTFQDTFDSPVGADLLEIELSGSANLSAAISGSTFDDGRTNGIQMLVNSATGELDVSGCTMTNQGIGIDMGVVGSGSLTFDVSSNPAITARPGYGTTMVNLFTDDAATATGRVNNNPNIRSGGVTTSGFGIRFNINGNSNATVEALNNTISDIYFDMGIDAVARGGTGRLDATITGNNVTVDATNALYDIRTQAQDGNTVCANVANNTASGVAIAAYRERTSAAGSTVYLQGFNTNATTTWNNNGNTPAGSVSESNSGTLAAPPAGTCATVP